MKKFFSNRITIALIFLLIGGLLGGGIGYHFASHNRVHRPFLTQVPFEETEGLFEDFFKDRPFAHFRDSFEEMHQLQRQLSSGLNGWEEEIQRHEDSQFVYYDIDFKGQTPKALTVDVKDGQVSISGQLEKRQKEGGFSQHYISSFQKSFPVPADTESEKFKMEQEDGKVVIKFPRRKST